MNYIHDDMNRAWVMEYLKKAIFMKAHELYVQTRCEVFLLVRYADGEKDGQYYSTSEILKEFNQDGLFKYSNCKQVTEGRGTVVAEKQTQFDLQELDCCIEINKHDDDNDTDKASATVARTPQIARTTQMARTPLSSGAVTTQPTQFQMIDEKGNEIPTSPATLQADPMPVLNNYVMMSKTQLAATQASPSPVATDDTTPIKRSSSNSNIEMLKNIRGDAATKASTSQTICECGLCNKTFGNPDVLRKHVNRFHTEYVGEGGAKDFSGRNAQGRFPCNVCGKTYKYHHHMKEHRQTHAKIKPFICKVCDKQFHRHRELRIHQLRHTSLPKYKYKYKCVQCSKSYYTLASLEEHKNIHTAHMVCCHLCGKCFNNRSSLGTHLQLCHNITFREQTKKELVNQVEPINEDGEIAPATMLSECFSNLDYAKQDAQSRSEDDSMADEMPKEDQRIIIKEGPLDPKYEKVLLSCSMVTEGGEEEEHDDAILVENIQGYVDSHKGDGIEGSEGDDKEGSVLLTAESDDEDEPHPKMMEEGEISMSKDCDICGKKFSHPQQMIMHRCIHFETSITHKCTICKETFDETSHFRGHVITHVDKFTRACLICGREFTRAAYVRRHLRGASCRPIRKAAVDIKSAEAVMCE